LAAASSSRSSSVNIRDSDGGAAPSPDAGDRALSHESWLSREITRNWGKSLPLARGTGMVPTAALIRKPPRTTDLRETYRRLLANGINVSHQSQQSASPQSSSSAIWHGSVQWSRSKSRPRFAARVRYRSPGLVSPRCRASSLVSRPARPHSAHEAGLTRHGRGYCRKKTNIFYAYPEGLAQRRYNVRVRYTSRRRRRSGCDPPYWPACGVGERFWPAACKNVKPASPVRGSICKSQRLSRWVRRCKANLLGW